MRKEAGYEVMDKIEVAVSGNEKISDIVKANKDKIASEVLANDIYFEVLNKDSKYEKEWNINSEMVTLAVNKLA